MLTELYIENFAIIEKLRLRFQDGLITFTGETGAGKSIIMDALNTLLGSRADTTFIRSGADYALIEATFKIPAIPRQAIHNILEAEALLDDPDYLTLGRELRRDSRNVVRINGRTASVSTLRQLGEYLVDIHGQSEHLSLLREKEHIHLLDRYADIKAELTAYRQTYTSLQRTRQELSRLRQNEQEAARRADLLTYQINEIRSAALQPDEDKELEEERNRLANAEKLATLGQKALLLLDESTPDEPSIIERLGEAGAALDHLADIDGSQRPLHERATAALEELSDLSRTLRLYLENIEFNPQRLDQVEERLELIANLKRKYGADIPTILQFAENAQQQLDEITHAEERIAQLEAQESTLLTRLGEQALALSQKRHQAAEILQQAIEGELNDLRMSGARFQVSFTTEEDPNGLPLPDGRRVAFSTDGHERITFLIETNPGEGFKPLARVASGGETSRLMLAMKNVLARVDHIPTLVFDEIDQGIGGRVGFIVGHKLWQLSANHQVLCITHLPQLAAFGKQHFRVQKFITGGRTITQAEEIQGENRLRELAQMLGELSEGTLNSAREILKTAAQITQNA